jgi:hypothetical protein
VRSLLLDDQRMEDFEIGSALIALLAVPDECELALRQDMFEALCGSAVRAHMTSFPEAVVEARDLWSRFLHIDLKTIRRRLITLERRLRDRMAAAEMVIGHLFEAISGQSAMLPSSVKRMSINELSELVRARTGQADSKRVRRRIYEASKPVLPLATAFLVCARAARADSEVSVATYPIWDGELHKLICQISREHERFLLANDRLRIDHNCVVRVRLRSELFLPATY